MKATSNKQPPPPCLLVSFGDARIILRCSKQTLHDWIADKKCPLHEVKRGFLSFLSLARFLLPGCPAAEACESLRVLLHPACRSALPSSQSTRGEAGSSRRSGSPRAHASSSGQRRPVDRGIKRPRRQPVRKGGSTSPPIVSPPQSTAGSKGRATTAILASFDVQAAAIVRRDRDAARRRRAS